MFSVATEIVLPPTSMCLGTFSGGLHATRTAFSVSAREKVSLSNGSEAGSVFHSATVYQGMFTISFGETAAFASRERGFVVPTSVFYALGGSSAGQ